MTSKYRKLFIIGNGFDRWQGLPTSYDHFKEFYISSFDSVYKNKIAFCIIKFLDGKKQIVLTHNTDLIRLLDVQLNNCFKK